MQYLAVYLGFNLLCMLLFKNFVKSSNYANIKQAQAAHGAWFADYVKIVIHLRGNFKLTDFYHLLQNTARHKKTVARQVWEDLQDPELANYDIDEHLHNKKAGQVIGGLIAVLFAFIGPYAWATSTEYVQFNTQKDFENALQNAKNGAAEVLNCSTGGTSPENLQEIVDNADLTKKEMAQFKSEIAQKIENIKADKGV